jgi:hypothetical protein
MRTVDLIRAYFALKSSDGMQLKLTPDEADAMADALRKHAAYVRQHDADVVVSMHHTQREKK